jgi:SNF2 family DNA or RNA helicase
MNALIYIGLPKALREALQHLASRERIDFLTESIQEQLRLADPTSTENPLGPDFDVENTNSLDIGWSEGVEDLRDLTEEQLWTILGIPDRKIPLFNDTVDPQGVHDPWTEEGRVWLDSGNGEPLLLRQYQLVGVVKMVQNAFAGMPVLLMDAVGLGKTIQVIAVIAILNWYREYHDKHSRFPGTFGESPFSGKLIVTLMSLSNQPASSGEKASPTSLVYQLRSLSPYLS